MKRLEKHSQSRHASPVNKMKTSEKISRQVLASYGLIAGEQARAKREKLGDVLRIGYTNAKQLEKRLAMFRITETELAEAMKIVEEEL